VPERLCIDLESGLLAEDRASAFVAAYAAVRPLTNNERRLLPALMRGAALRFWISRLWICTCRATPACSSRTTRPTSSVCCASAWPRPWHPTPA